MLYIGWIYLAFASSTEQIDSALVVLSDKILGTIGWLKRRFLVQRQLMLDGMGNDYFQSTWSTFDRIQWLETEYQRVYSMTI